MPAAFAVLRFLVGQAPTMTGRGAPFFAVTGYGLIFLAGALMLFQSLRRAETHPHILTAGIGLLPCPLTITVLGFAWAQGPGAMIAVVLLALAAGIALTIGFVALAAIAARRFIGHALIEHLPRFERSARVLQGAAGAAIMAVAAYSIATSV